MPFSFFCHVYQTISSMCFRVCELLIVTSQVHWYLKLCVVCFHHESFVCRFAILFLFVCLCLFFSFDLFYCFTFASVCIYGNLATYVWQVVLCGDEVCKQKTMFHMLAHFFPHFSSNISVSFFSHIFILLKFLLSCISNHFINMFPCL